MKAGNIPHSVPSSRSSSGGAWPGGKTVRLPKKFQQGGNSGAFNTAHGGYVRFVTPGSPDIIIVVHSGRPYFPEVKQPGTYQSPEQKSFQLPAEKASAFYAVVRSIEDVQALGL
jgi:hypothetical protein